MSTDKSDLEPLDPETGVELFIEHKATDCAASTVQNHRYRMKHFLEWCDETGTENLNDLSGRDIQRYRLWLADGDDINAITMKPRTAGCLLSDMFVGNPGLARAVHRSRTTATPPTPTTVL